MKEIKLRPTNKGWAFKCPYCKMTNNYVSPSDVLKATVTCEFCKTIILKGSAK